MSFLLDIRYLERPYDIPPFNIYTLLLCLRCPIVTSLGVMTYNFDAHTWGFEFKVPKFQGYDQLYLVCNSYVCDPALDPKPYCDRSCSSAKAKRSIASQSAQANVQGGPFILIDGDDTRSNTDRPHGVKTSSSSTGSYKGIHWGRDQVHHDGNYFSVIYSVVRCLHNPL